VRVPARRSGDFIAPKILLALRPKDVAEARIRGRRLDMLSDLCRALGESADMLGHGWDERIIPERARFEIATADAARPRAAGSMRRSHSSGRRPIARVSATPICCATATSPANRSAGFASGSA
jgi:hypothetical protein